MQGSLPEKPSPYGFCLLSINDGLLRVEWFAILGQLGFCRSASASVPFLPYNMSLCFFYNMSLWSLRDLVLEGSNLVAPEGWAP